MPGRMVPRECMRRNGAAQGKLVSDDEGSRGNVCLIERALERLPLQQGSQVSRAVRFDKDLSPTCSQRSTIFSEVDCDEIGMAYGDGAPHMPLGYAARPVHSSLDAGDFRISEQLLGAPSRFCRPQSILWAVLVSTLYSTKFV